MNGIKTLQLAVIEATVKAREVIKKHELLFMTAVQKAQMMAEEQNAEIEENGRNQTELSEVAIASGGREDTGEGGGGYAPQQ